MTSVETLRQRTGQPSDVVERLDGLSRAVDASRGRLDARLVDDAASVVDRAGARLRLSSEHTVVALAGATGSGKSSMFNSLCDLDLAAVGVKRPTTSWALACAWGPVGASDLLDWLGIPKRHQVNRMGMLDETADDRAFQGLVLLDLPDHDSTEVSHHLEVERLVKLADVLVWVLDPQKYADAAIHDRFLRPLASHADVMVVALNHIDEVPPDDVEACLADVRRLLELDGLHDVPVVATSAKVGTGISELRAVIADRVAGKKLARDRLTADIRAVAGQMAERTGDAYPADVRTFARAELLDACSDAVGVPVLVDKIADATTVRGRRVTGWPVTAWFGRRHRDPMRKLDLPESGEGGDPLSAADLRAMRATMPTPTPVQRARLDAAVRSVADEVTEGMPKAWDSAIRSASTARLDELNRGLDAAVGETDLGVARNPLWWALARVLQWLLLLAAVGGAGWLVGLGISKLLGRTTSKPPYLGGLAVPVVLLVGGLVLGIALAVVCRVLVRVSSRRRSSRAGTRLVDAIASAVDEFVVAPIQAEVDAYVTCRDGLAIALRK